MKLSRRMRDRINPQLVERINEICHDLISTRYHRRPGQVYSIEKDFWHKAAEKYLVRAEPLVCLDFGAGAGSLALTIGQYFKKEDTFICSDISARALEKCEHNIREKSFSCGFSFIKIKGMKIPLEDDSVDVITLNSVLHHIFDLKAFSKECERILKQAGLVIATHEPNERGSLPVPGRIVRVLASIILRPRFLFFKLAEISPFVERAMRSALNKVSRRYRLRNKMLSELAEQLKKEGLVDFNIRGTELQQIVDFHAQRGFARQTLMTEIFPSFRIIAWESYNHLGFSGDDKLHNVVNKFMKRKWPDAGTNIRFILSRQRL